MYCALIIEDDDNNMQLVCDILEYNGYETIGAQTGEEGFKLALQRKPSFIILDIQLPDINGLDVLRKIRSTTEGKHIPVIAMTSFAMAGDRESMLAAGCNGYIEKPIDPERVMSQIMEITGGSS
jgi:two-component system, cell cycle response regulator DivK